MLGLGGFEWGGDQKYNSIKPSAYFFYYLPLCRRRSPFAPPASIIDARPCLAVPPLPLQSLPPLPPQPLSPIVAVVATAVDVSIAFHVDCSVLIIFCKTPGVVDSAL